MANFASPFNQTDAQGALRALAALPSASRTLLIGAADTGKTTFARDAINALASSEALKVALVDADIGQSDVGPPGTIGLCAVSPGEACLPLKSLHGLPLIGASFVGATSVSAHIPQMLAGLAGMVRSAQRIGDPAERILVDMPGFISGPAARAFLRAAVACVDPALVLAFARGDEMAAILHGFAHLSAPPVVAIVRPGPEVGRKTPAMRSARRGARFAQYLAHAAPLVLPWQDVDLIETPLGAGRALAPHLLKFIGNAVGGRCLWAEQDQERAVFAIMAGSGRKWVVSALEEAFATRHIHLVAESHLNGLLCGLLDEHAHFLGIGILQSLDYLRQELTLLTPVRAASAVAQVVFGAIRLAPDGREIGPIRPGPV